MISLNFARHVIFLKSRHVTSEKGFPELNFHFLLLFVTSTPKLFLSLLIQTMSRRECTCSHGIPLKDIDPDTVRLPNSRIVKQMLDTVYAFEGVVSGPSSRYRITGEASESLLAFVPTKHKNIFKNTAEANFACIVQNGTVTLSDIPADAVVHFPKLVDLRKDKTNCDMVEVSVDGSAVARMEVYYIDSPRKEVTKMYPYFDVDGICMNSCTMGTHFGIVIEGVNKLECLTSRLKRKTFSSIVEPDKEEDINNMFRKRRKMEKRGWMYVSDDNTMRITSVTPTQFGAHCILCNESEVDNDIESTQPVGNKIAYYTKCCNTFLHFACVKKSLPATLKFTRIVCPKKECGARLSLIDSSVSKTGYSRDTWFRSHESSNEDLSQIPYD